MFQETETWKKFFIFQETELSYISGNANPKKFLIFQEMEKISCTLGLLLILLAERKLFKHKREINYF